MISKGRQPHQLLTCLIWWKNSYSFLLLNVLLFKMPNLNTFSARYYRRELVNMEQFKGAHFCLCRSQTSKKELYKRFIYELFQMFLLCITSCSAHLHTHCRVWGEPPAFLPLKSIKQQVCSWCIDKIFTAHFSLSQFTHTHSSVTPSLCGCRVVVLHYTLH